MSVFTHRELKRMAIVAGTLTAVGLVMILTTRGELPHENFWHPYVVAIGGIGFLLLMFGAIWCALSVAHLTTDFFNLKRSLDSGGFAGSMAAIAVAVLLLMILTLPRLPATPPSRLPADPKGRQQIVRMEANFKLLVIVALLAGGVGVASVPFRRFFRK